jgi:chorismate synthase
VGGVSEIHIHGLPAGLGDPVFSKLDAMLAYACMSIGGVKGVEFGAGFESARMRGSQHNDAITKNGFATNNAGGILGGISNGDTIILRLAVKPTSSIGIRQRTINEAGQETEVEIQGRHDACIAPRLLPVAEAMCCLAIYDAMLSQADMSDDARDAEDEVITCYDWDSISKVISQGNGVQ